MSETTMNRAEVRSLDRVREWELNPRGGVYRDLEPLVESLRAVGLQDPIHVWERVDGDVILKGHRRVAAMRALGWAECLQVVHHFDDERAAYLWLLQDHGHTSALDPWENCVAVRNGVRLGLNVDDLAPAIGRSAERVQLWLDLEKGLPVKAKNALASGALSVNTAELLLQVEDEGQRREAVQMILCDQVTREPMSHGQARALVQSLYVLPAKRRKEWLAKVPGIRRKHPVGEGFQIVDWEQRGDYVQGDTGQPWPDFEFGDAFCPKDALGRRWMERARAVEVPVLVVPAPLYGDQGWVLLVNRKMLLAAEEANAAVGRREAVEAEDSGDEGEVRVVGPELGDGGRGVRVEVDAEAYGNEEEARDAVRLVMGAVMERVTANPAAAMTTPVWAAVLPALVDLAMSGETVKLWLGEEMSEDELLSKVRADERHRGSIRWALMLALCALADQEGELSGVQAVASGMGVEVVF